MGSHAEGHRRYAHPANGQRHISVFERSVRGEVIMITTRHAKSNNPYMGLIRGTTPKREYGSAKRTNHFATIFYRWRLWVLPQFFYFIVECWFFVLNWRSMSHTQCILCFKLTWSNCRKHQYLCRSSNRPTSELFNFNLSPIWYCSCTFKRSSKKLVDSYTVKRAKKLENKN